VGSNTAPNVLGMAWFFDRVWPEIRRAHPAAELQVAGSVCRALGPAPEGVRYLGVVGALEPLYAGAGVVISPLTAGSGLKIKLVEAMAEGKACVVTSVTLQGVEQELGAAVARADASEAFAEAVGALLYDRAAREALGARALQAVRDGFSPERGHAAFREWLHARGGAAPLLQSQPAA
jgi:succinoglycan biosynthesis protein ExoO